MTKYGECITSHSTFWFNIRHYSKKPSGEGLGFSVRGVMGVAFNFFMINTFYKFQAKNLKRDSNSDLQISSLALYHWATLVLIPIHLQTLLLKCLPLFCKAVWFMTLPAIYWSLSELISLLNKYDVLNQLIKCLNQIISENKPYNLRPCRFTFYKFQEESLKVNWNKNQDSSMVERQARDLEARGSNPGQDSIFSDEIKYQFCKTQIISFYLLINMI